MRAGATGVPMITSPELMGFCMSALAAVVDKPVAEASAERGPLKGVSGLPRTVIGFTIVTISGISTSIK